MVRSLRSASFSQSVVNSTSAWRPSVCTSIRSVVTSKFSLCSFEKKQSQKLNTQETEPSSWKWLLNCTAKDSTRVYLRILCEGNLCRRRLTLAVMVPCVSPLLLIILIPALWNMSFISSGVAVVAKSTSSGLFPDNRSRTAPPAIRSSNWFFSNNSARMEKICMSTLPHQFYSHCTVTESEEIFFALISTSRFDFRDSIWRNKLTLYCI